MLSKRTVASAALPVCVLFAAACGNSVSASPGASEPASSSAAAVPSPRPSAVAAVASPSPIASAAMLDVSPAEQNVGAITLSLAFEPARHMVDQTGRLNARNVDPAQPTATLPAGASQGAVVLSDMLHVTNNVDPTQDLPPDSTQSILRHVVVDVTAGDASHPVPYLGVSMDILLDGHPVGFGQAVVPMVAADTSAPSLYYGNNIRLGQHGVYQVFIRLNGSPLLGSDQQQSAQFNVTVH